MGWLTELQTTYELKADSWTDYIFGAGATRLSRDGFKVGPDWLESIFGQIPEGLGFDQDYEGEAKVFRDHAIHDNVSEPVFIMRI